MIAGIRSLEDLRIRCRIDEVTACWNWGMAVQTYGGQRAGEPRVWLASENRCVNGKRAALILAGRAPKRGQVTYGTCTNWRCVNPEHIEAGTHAERGAFQAASGRLQNNPARIAAITRNSRTRSRITEELAQWARESDQTCADVAAALGVGLSVVSRIRRGEAWRSTVALGAAAGPFEQLLRMAA